MATAGYVPDAGDLIWLTFDPQAGREQAGRRPTLVLSPERIAHCPLDVINEVLAEPAPLLES